MKTFRCIALFFFFFFFVWASAQKNGFELKVSVKDYPDSLQNVLLLGRYYGSNQYITDTAKYNPKTKQYIFSNDKAKEGGLYLLISADKHFGEIIIDKNQNFEMETSYPRLGESPLFKNSPENKVYQDFSQKGRDSFKKIDEEQKVYGQAKKEGDSVSLKASQSKLEKLYTDFEKLKEDFIKENPDHVMSLIFKAQTDIKVPDAPATLPDSLKRVWQYQYFKEHFFDNIDLCDDRILRTPLFHQRFETYMDKVLPQHADSIKLALEEFIEKARCSKEIFKYAVWYPVDKYQRSEIIGHDAIWVYLADKYYTKEEAFWASPAILENFAKKVKRLKPLLIGSVPPEFMCPDSTVESSNPNWVSVFSSKKRYTIVIFWEMSCGHCKKTMPKLLDFYHEKGKELDFEVIAIGKDFDVPAWKNYVREHHFDFINLNGKTASLDYNDEWDIYSTPTIYVLDSKKRIVTKRIDVEHIEPFIRMWNDLYYSGK